MATTNKRAEEKRKAIHAAFAAADIGELQKKVYVFNAVTIDGEWFVSVSSGMKKVDMLFRVVEPKPTIHTGGYSFERVCKVCQADECYAHCQNSPMGDHDADPRSGQQPRDSDFLID